MFLQSIKKLKFLIIPIVFSFLVFGFACTNMASHVSMQGNMNMADMAAKTGQQSCCNTGISHTTDSLKNVVLAVPDKIHDSLILLALGFAPMGSWLWFKERFVSPDPDRLRGIFYIKQHPNIPLFNHLKLAFARGILNPKIY